jgi:ApbE superfamily uncharacterized protein (UPF0280 family)
MNSRAQIRMLPDGQRLHMHDGPIDLIVEAFGTTAAIERSYRAATARFADVLDELCGELAFLRRPTQVDGALPNGPIAQRMVAAVEPFAASTFMTPMAAVAGAVAEEILFAMTTEANLSRAYVNDGGDIALHLSPEENFVIGMVERPDRPSLLGTATIDFDQPVRGIATSGWRGRSFSLGIADAVTVLADTAAMADAAATVIANAVDLPGHPAIKRVAACELAPDSDLGSRMVTLGVGNLRGGEIEAALRAGVLLAERLRDTGLIRAAALSLQGETRAVNARQQMSAERTARPMQRRNSLPKNSEMSVQPWKSGPSGPRKPLKINVGFSPRVPYPELFQQTAKPIRKTSPDRSGEPLRHTKTSGGRLDARG